MKNFKGKKFFVNSNNGVYVIVDEESMKNFKKSRAILDALDKYMNQEQEKKIFMLLKNKFSSNFFCFRDEPEPWFLGDCADFSHLKSYIKDQGGKIIEESLYVPFSNGYELGIHGEVLQLEELAYASSCKEFKKVFGIFPEEIPIIDF